MTLTAEDKKWITNALDDKLTGIARGLPSKHSAIIKDKTLETIVNTGKFLKSVPKSIETTVVNQLAKTRKVFNGVVSSVKNANTVVVKQVNLLKNSIVKNIETFKTGIMKTVNGVKTNILNFVSIFSPKRILSNLANSIKNIIFNNPIMKGISNVLNIGKNMVKGAISGISNLLGLRKNYVQADNFENINTLGGSSKNYVIAKDATFTGTTNVFVGALDTNSYQERLEKERTNKHNLLVSTTLKDLKNLSKDINDKLKDFGLKKMIIAGGLLAGAALVIANLDKIIPFIKNMALPALKTTYDFLKDHGKDILKVVSALLGINLLSQIIRPLSHIFKIVGGISKVLMKFPKISPYAMPILGPILAAAGIAAAVKIGQEASKNVVNRQPAAADSYWRKYNELNDTSQNLKLNNEDYAEKMNSTKFSNITEPKNLGKPRGMGLGKYGKYDNLALLEYSSEGNVPVLAPFDGTIDKLEAYTENDYEDTWEKSGHKSYDSSNLKVYYKVDLYTSKRRIQLKGFIEPNVYNKQEIPRGYPIGIATNKFQVIADTTNFDQKDYNEMYNKQSKDNYSFAFDLSKHYRDKDKTQEFIDEQRGVAIDQAKMSQKILKNKGIDYTPPEGMMTDEGLVVTREQTSENLQKGLQQTQKANPNNVKTNENKQSEITITIPSETQQSNSSNSMTSYGPGSDNDSQMYPNQRAIISY